MALSWRQFRGTKCVSRASYFVLAAASLTLAACTSGTGPDATSAIFTDGPAYTAKSTGPGQYSFTVVATFFNESRATVFLATCGAQSGPPEFGVSTAEPQSMPAAYNPLWSCVANDKKIAVGPGMSRVDTLTITGPNSWDGHTGAPIGVLEGVFRLTYRVLGCRDENGCNMSWVTGSNTFRVKRIG